MKRYIRLGEQLFSTSVNVGESHDLVCVGYRKSSVKCILFGFCCLITGGFLLLVRRWKPRWTMDLQFTKCSLEIADVVFLSENDGSGSCFVCSMRQVSVEEVPPEFFKYLQPLDVDDCSGNVETCKFPPPSNGSPSSRCLRYFDFRFDKFLWNFELRKFIRLLGVGQQHNAKCGEILSKYRGWDKDEQEKRRSFYGPNCITVEVKSYWSLLIHEVLNPFYVFQIASLTLWCFDDYYIYAGCIFFISFVSIVIELLETRKQYETLRNMVSSANNTSAIVRRKDGINFETMSSQMLCPGDVIMIPAEGCLLSCDALLLNGTCIVNESMLTGESVPVTKCAMSKSEESETFSFETHKKHVLFCGTTVVQTRFYGGKKVSALVLRTGFLTAKGELVKDILFPKSVSFKFYRDAMIFISILAVVALLGTCYSLYIFISRGADVKKIVIRGLDIVTIVVPPALPAAMTVGIWYAQRRLKKKEIFCINPPRINVCGKLNLICFDKTGTLTEEGLDFLGVLPSYDACFGQTVEDPSVLPFSPLVTCMTSCHSLTVINGKLSGDPLDLIMFKATKWELTEPELEESAQYDVMAPTIVRPLGSGEESRDVENEENLFNLPEDEPSSSESIALRILVKSKRKYFIETSDSGEEPLEIGILRQFPFSSTLQRSAVVVRRLGGRSMEIYVKGAPEKIVALCKSSTMPDNFYDVLEEQTKKGHRVIALAWKLLDRKLLWHHLQRMKREELEQDLDFIGLMVMQNKLKVQSKPVIEELREAEIRTVMVTGDNLLTALSVASECKMLLEEDNMQIVNVTLCANGTPNLEYQSYSIATGGAESVDVCSDARNSYQKINNSNFVRYALTGYSFAHLKEFYPDIFEKIVLHGAVFARMSPHQKSQLVEAYQNLGYIVGMCGDGANDCGALKVSHAGISLSDSEASVASPFTSRIQTISCVPAIIKEGRCALVTSFGVFKYMAIYSLIQFISVLILYTVKTNLGDYMFLFIDLFIITSVAFLMGRSKPSDILSIRRPSSSLLSLPVVVSLFAQLAFLVLFQIGSLIYVVHRPWYVPHNPTPNEDIYVSWETTTIFFITCYQYIIMAYVFSRGLPYRQPIYKNRWFLCALILLTCLITLLLTISSSIFHRWLQLISVDYELWRYKLVVIIMALLNVIVCASFEEYVVNSELIRTMKRSLCRKRSKTRYKVLLSDKSSSDGSFL